MATGSGIDRLTSLILDSICEGVFTVDREFRVTWLNAEAERITGIRRAAAVGRKCHEVFRASVCQTGCALRRTLETGAPVRRARIEVLNAAMEVVPIEVSTAVLKDRAGRMLGGVEIFRDVSDVEALRRELSGPGTLADIVGESPALREALAILPDVAASDTPVLISGPSGTGKELVARAIHEQSSRCDKPFVRVNCGALPDTLLESELFGHVKGAFTDARRDRAGRFVTAHRGTLFLDEVGELSPAFQVKLLRVLEDGEVHPLGATKSVRVDVRLVSASNADLARRVRQGAFREDLYYRVRVVEIALPRLADRAEDLPLLVEHFVRRLAARTGKPIRSVSAAALAALSRHDFPGNVRELRNILERAFVVCHGSTIEPSHLPAEIVATTDRDEAPRGGRVAHAPARAPVERRAPPADAAAESRRLLAALDAHHWNRTEAARELGIARNTLWRRMRALGLVRVRSS